MPFPSQSVQEYWLPGFGLSKQIVLSQLQFFLGPSATVRPFTYHGRDGYLIHGLRLTRQQIEDLQRQSKEYERQQAMRMSSRAVRGDDQSDTYINEPVVVGPARSSPPDFRNFQSYPSRHSPNGYRW